MLKWLPGFRRSGCRRNMSIRNGYWIATNLYVLTPGYNTDLVPKGTEPKTYQDLLDPEMEGQDGLALESVSSPAVPGFVGLVLDRHGRREGHGLSARSSPSSKSPALTLSARQVLDQVIAGEYSFALADLQPSCR